MRQRLRNFFDCISTFPWAFEYLVLYFLVGDPLSFGFSKEERVHYLVWVIDVFDATRFLCALAFFPRVAFEHVRSRALSCSFMYAYMDAFFPRGKKSKNDEIQSGSFDHRMKFR